MRPLALTLSGFRSHKSTTDFDFTNKNLLAIVGPTGAGKSSILDGIAFALYAKTPSVKGATKQLICNRSERADVILRFSVDDTHYEVTRVISRRGPSEHVLEEVDSGEQIRGEGPVNVRIEELLGLDFDAFCSSVLLAQGRFDRFLSAKPTDRTRILEGLFRLERIGDIRALAKETSDLIALDIARIEGSLDRIPEDIDDQIDAANHELIEIGSRIEVLDGALEAETNLLQAAKDAEAARARIEAAVGKLHAGLDGLPQEEELASFQDEQAVVASALQRSSAALEAAETTLVSARGSLKAIEAETGSEAELAALRARVEGFIRLTGEIEAVAAGLGDLEARAKTTAETLGTAEEKLVGAEEDLAAATDERAELERLHSAHALRAHLVAGEPCPVCEQPVAALPKTPPLGTLEEARARVERAEATVKEARTKVTAAQSVAVKARADLDATLERLEAARTEHETLKVSIESHLGSASDHMAVIEQRTRRLRDAAAGVEKAVASRDEASHARDAALAAQQAAAKRRQAILLAVTRAATLADIDQPDDDPEALVAAAELTRHALTQRVTVAADELQEIRRATDETDEALAALRNQVALPPDRPVAEAISEQQTRRKLAEATVARLAKDKEEAAELVAARTRHLERKQTYDTIADDMRAVNFLSFLLEERRQLLIELGSERLRDMTGRYRFSFDSKQSLQVVDELSADAERPVGSLSGGETFLASLALALALADLVAREGGRLECFFLDEGFGSLDPESFDMAMDGIEHLVAGDRLIGLVSHVEALKARVEDKIVLDKGADGTTVVVDEPAYAVEGSFT